MTVASIPSILTSASGVLLIDGPSGAGKSTFARALVDAWPGPVDPVLVRMDDLYPGWSGLDAASDDLVDHLLRPRRLGRPARWRRYDRIGERLAEWHSVPADRPLVVEGCGALSRASSSLADLRCWIDAPAAVRRRRALARDEGAFDAHWDMWAAQVESFVERERPQRLADVVIRNLDGEARRWVEDVCGQRP